MQVSSFSYARQNLASTMDNVIKNHAPITITRQNKEPVIMISLKDYNSMVETAYLMQSGNNAQRLNQAIGELESGFGEVRELIEDE